MIRINETIEIAAPPDVIWNILHDPAVVATCIPGAELIAEISPGLFEAAMTIKFGPTVAQFTGEARVEYDDAARRCIVSGRGNDKRGSSPATGSGAIRLEGETTSKLTIEGQFEVSGPLEAFVDTGGVFVARALLAQFAANIGQLVQKKPEEPGAPAATPPAPAPMQPLSVAGLMRGAAIEFFRAMMKWFRGEK